MVAHRPGAAQRQPAAAGRRADQGAGPEGGHRGGGRAGAGRRAQCRCCWSSRTSPWCAGWPTRAVVLDRRPGRPRRRRRATLLADAGLHPAAARRVRDVRRTTAAVRSTHEYRRPARVTGLGLGALYFLIASGLSLIFGLMDVLNFAHGAVPGRRRVRHLVGRPRICRAPADGVASSSRSLVGIAVGTLVAALVELGADPPAVRPAHRAGAGHRRAVGWPGSRCCRRSGAPTRGRSPGRPGSRHGPTSAAPRCPNDRFLLIVAGGRWCWPGCVLFLRCTRLRPDHPRRRGEPRHGDRARHRRAQRRSPWSSRSAGPRPALAGVLGGVYFGSVSPGQGASLLIFAFIVVVIGGLGLGHRLRASPRSLVGLVQQFANYYAASGLGDLSRGAAARRRAAGPAAAASPGRPRRDDGAVGCPAYARSRWRGLRLVLLLAVAAVLRAAACPACCRRPLERARHPAAARASACVFAALRSATTCCSGVTGLLSFGHALYFAAGGYVHRRSR